MNHNKNKYYHDPIDDFVESAMSHPIWSVLFCLFCAIAFYGIIWLLLAGGIMLGL
jgi:hypothetical protein